MSDDEEIDTEQIWEYASCLDDYSTILANDARSLSGQGKERKSRKKSIRKNALIDLRNSILENYLIDDVDCLKKEHNNQNDEFYTFYFKEETMRVNEEEISVHPSKIDDIGFAPGKNNTHNPTENLVEVLYNIKNDLDLNPNDYLEEKDMPYENKVYVQLHEDITWDFERVERMRESENSD